MEGAAGLAPAPGRFADGRVALSPRARILEERTGLEPACPEGHPVSTGAAYRFATPLLEEGGRVELPRQVVSPVPFRAEWACRMPKPSRWYQPSDSHRNLLLMREVSWSWTRLANVVRLRRGSGGASRRSCDLRSQRRGMEPVVGVAPTSSAYRAEVLRLNETGMACPP